MNKELLLVKNPKLIPTRRRTNTMIRDSPGSPLKYTLDICKIGANTLYYSMKRLNTEFFQTSLYKISRILEERQLIQDKDFKTLELIRRRLPKYYTAFKAAFFKSASNQLLPHQPYDHKIQLEQELVYSSTPLY